MWLASVADKIVLALAWLYNTSSYRSSARRLYPLEKYLIDAIVRAVPKEIGWAMARQIEYYNLYIRQWDSQVLEFYHIERFSERFDHALDLPVNTNNKIRLCRVWFRVGESSVDWFVDAFSQRKRLKNLFFVRSAKSILTETDVRILRVRPITRKVLELPTGGTIDDLYRAHPEV